LPEKEEDQKAKNESWTSTLEVREKESLPANVALQRAQLTVAGIGSTEEHRIELN
jgi:hypothetical protein